MISFDSSKMQKPTAIGLFSFTFVRAAWSPPVWDPGEGKNRPTLLSWPDVVRAD